MEDRPDRVGKDPACILCFYTITLAALHCAELHCTELHCTALLPSSESSDTAEFLLQATSLTHKRTSFHLCSSLDTLQMEAFLVCTSFTLS